MVSFVTFDVTTATEDLLRQGYGDQGRRWALSAIALATSGFVRHSFSDGGGCHAQRGFNLAQRGCGKPSPIFFFVVQCIHMKKLPMWLNVLIIIITLLILAGVIAIVIGPRESSVNSDLAAERAAIFLEANTRADFASNPDDVRDVGEFLENSRTSSDAGSIDQQLLDEYFTQ